jgi:spore maturation protein CgeB
MMRVLFIDSGEIWSTNLTRGFQDNGHDVLISGPITKENLSKMIQEFKPDFAITVGWGQEHTLEKQKIIREKMEQHKLPLVYWAVEDSAYTEVWSIPFVQAIKPNYVFTICPNTVKTYEQLGIPAAYLAFGFEDSIHRPTKSEQQYEADIAIVANAYPDILRDYPDHFRHQSIQTLITPLLEANIKIDFWGKNWDKMSDYFGLEIPQEWIRGYMEYKNANKVYNSAKIMLGLQNYPYILTQRTYEILGSGGFLLTIDTPAVRNNFSSSKDLIVSSSPQETIKKVISYLNKPEKRKVIQERCRTSVQVHSYRNRAKEIIDKLIESGIAVDRNSSNQEKGKIITFSCNEKVEFLEYEVQKGDTLLKISKHFGISVKEIMDINLLTSDVIIESQMLKVRKKV